MKVAQMMTVVVVFVGISCAPEQAVAPDRALSAEEQVTQELLVVSKAIGARDVAAFKASLAPELVDALSRQVPDVDEALGKVIEQQRTSWLKVVGDGSSSPQILSIEEGYGGSFALSLASPDAMEKKLYFLRTPEGVRFTGPRNLRPGPAVLAATAVDNVFAFRYLDHSSVYPLAVCTTPWRGSNTCPGFPPEGCAGYHSAPVYPTSGYSHTENTNCAEGHVLSCGVGVGGSDDSCLRPSGGCWYQWVFADIWRNTDASYDCGG